MAKKQSKATKPSVAPKASKSSAGKSSTKSRSKKSPPKQHHDHDEEMEEIELDETESKAIDLVRESDAVCDALETEVNKVVTQAVRKIYKAYGASLTAAQAQNVATVLFGNYD